MNGVFYVATGEKYRLEAIKSVESLKKHNPTIHTTIFSDSNNGLEMFDRYINISHPSFSFEDKITCFQAIDYNKAIFLDADTYITSDINDLFQLLDKYDFAASIEVARGYWYNNLSIPDSFPELNSGVVAFKNTDQIRDLFAKWKLYHEESKEWQANHEWQKNNAWDQPGLRQALYNSTNIKTSILPNEYNALRHNGTYLWGCAKIVHGRGNIEDVASRMNRDINLERSFFQGFGIISDFSRISVKQICKTVIRINVCALLEIIKRFKNKL